MVITDIKIRKVFDESPMKAIVSVTFDDQLAVHDIKVINTKDKLFIVMPSRKNPDNTYRNYKWILLRDQDGSWSHADHGYG